MSEDDKVLRSGCNRTRGVATDFHGHCNEPELAACNSIKI